MQPRHYRIVFDPSFSFIRTQIEYGANKGKKTNFNFWCQFFESFASYHDQQFSKYMPDILYNCAVFSF